VGRRRSNCGTRALRPDAKWRISQSYPSPDFDEQVTGQTGLAAGLEPLEHSKAKA
jgi:hypothetical protein